MLIVFIYLAGGKAREDFLAKKEGTLVNRKRYRLLWRIFPVGCGAILAVFVVCAGVLSMVRSQTRYTVIGPTDPATGIRIEYTVSSHYIRKRDEEDTSKHHRRDGFVDWQFTPPSPPPSRGRLHKNILKSSETALEAEVRSTITQTSSKHTRMAGWYVDKRGFVRIDLKRSSERVMAGVASQECKMVGKCPTTLVVEDSDIIVNDHAMQYYDLLVRPRGQTIIYVFQATGIEGTLPNADLRELKAIRESVRVGKMKGSAHSSRQPSKENPHTVY